MLAVRESKGFQCPILPRRRPGKMADILNKISIERSLICIDFSVHSANETISDSIAPRMIRGRLKSHSPTQRNRQIVQEPETCSHRPRSKSIRRGGCQDCSEDILGDGV